jgi:hypothetical protein
MRTESAEAVHEGSSCIVKVRVNGAARATKRITTTAAAANKRREYVARFIRARQKSVEGFVEQGQIILEAKNDLPHGELLIMYEELGFKNPRRPQMLKRIAEHPIISNAKYFSLLPPCYATLYQLGQNTPHKLKQMLPIPEMDYKEAKQIANSFKKASSLGSLIAKLETVQPAIAINPTIPLLTHYWFTGKQLLANNGQIALQVPFESDFAGAVPNGVLDLLKAAGFKGDIKLASKDGNLLITEPQSSGVRMTLKMLKPTFPFKMPQHKQTNSNPQAIAELVDAIRYCLISVGTDTSIPECLGITLERDGKRIMLYSSDGSTISRTSISDQLPLEKRTTLPSSFCVQMLRLYDSRSEDSEVAFEIGERALEEDGKIERYALFTTGGATLYGRKPASLTISVTLWRGICLKATRSGSWKSRAAAQGGGLGICCL